MSSYTTIDSLVLYKNLWDIYGAVTCDSIPHSFTPLLILKKPLRKIANTEVNSNIKIRKWFTVKIVILQESPLSHGFLK